MFRRSSTTLATATLVCWVLLLQLLGSKPCAGAHIHPIGLELPGNYKRVIINVGSNIDPPSSPEPHTAVVAIEPLPEVVAAIRKEPHRYALAVAISNHTGVTIFHDFKDSSSLSGVPKGHMAELVISKAEEGMSATLVPTLTLSTLLRVLSRYECWFLKTDMQGFDFMAVHSAANDILRCPFIFSEIYCNGYEGYEGSMNDYHKHWLPHMTELGYVPEGQPCPDGFVGECNIFWRHSKAVGEPPAEVVCPNCYTRRRRLQSAAASDASSTINP